MPLVRGVGAWGEGGRRAGEPGKSRPGPQSRTRSPACPRRVAETRLPAALGDTGRISGNHATVPQRSRRQGPNQNASTVSASRVRSAEPHPVSLKEEGEPRRSRWRKLAGPQRQGERWLQLSGGPSPILSSRGRPRTQLRLPDGDMLLRLSQSKGDSGKGRWLAEFSLPRATKSKGDV